MVIKKSVNQIVWGIIESDIGLKKDLSRGVINIRALANYLIDKYSLNTSIDSVISALRRYFDNSEKLKEEKNIISLFKNATIKTRNHIFCLTLIKDAPIIEWYETIGVESKRTRVITGEYETKLILHNSLINSALKFFSKKFIVKESKDLGEISISIDEESIKTKGVMAKIAGEIALNDINIEEIIVCPPEYVIYVLGKDLVKVHHVLSNISSQN